MKLEQLRDIIVYSKNRSSKIKFWYKSLHNCLKCHGINVVFKRLYIKRTDAFKQYFSPKHRQFAFCCSCLEPKSDHKDRITEYEHDLLQLAILSRR